MHFEIKYLDNRRAWAWRPAGYPLWIDCASFPTAEAALADAIRTTLGKTAR